MFNAGSLIKNFDELNNLASLSHIDVIGITETWLHDELKDHEVSLPGCVLFRPSSKRRRGVALFNNTGKTVLVLAYRSPNTPLTPYVP